jgi:hypothetical protein
VKAPEPVPAGEPSPDPAAPPAEPAATLDPVPRAAAAAAAAHDTPLAPAAPLAPRGRRRRALAASLLAWMVPGCGHLFLGQWLRGLAFGLLVGASAAVGVVLRGRLFWFGVGVSAAPVDPTTSPESPLLVAAASVVSIGLGLPAAALRWLAGYQGDLTAPGYEIGTAFLLTAGLMNLLLVFDAWDEARW